MNASKEWSEGWRGFLGLSRGKSNNAVEILCRRYVEEARHAEQLKRHAEKMHYPQFRENLLRIANEKHQHVERIGQKILALGGRLPAVPELPTTHQNSWRRLMMALEEENRSADNLLDELRRLEPDRTDVIELLQRIAEEQKNHRDEIRHMLMRSDPFALSLA